MTGEAGFQHFAAFPGTASPMAHQREDVDRLANHARICLWNDLGTGKTYTLCWWLFRLWMAGTIDTVIVVGPGVCYADWAAALGGEAFAPGCCTLEDARPPGHMEVEAFLAAGLRPADGQLRAFYTTFDGLRALGAERLGKSRWGARDGSRFAAAVRGSRVALVIDEAHRVALDTSGQGKAARAVGSWASAVAVSTATPIGNPKHLRAWGLIACARPDVLSRYGARKFDQFKERYAVLHDPVLAARGGEGKPVAARSYAVAVREDLMRAEVLSGILPFTSHRKKADCLDLPDKVRFIRAFRLPAHAEKMVDDLIEEGRAFLPDGEPVVPKNVLEAILRFLELADGWLDGVPVHTAKLQALADVYEEFTDVHGREAPFLCWGSRSAGLVAAACVLAGYNPDEAQRLGTEAFIDRRPSPAYTKTVEAIEKRGVGLIHGPTQTFDRERVQALWKRGELRCVVAHPAVAGAGLNWQHVKATAYFSQPLGSIARSQSEDRVHRKNLKHLAVYYDIVSEDGSDLAVAKAHAKERDAERALLSWISEYAR